MKQRRRIYYSAAQRSEIWDRWQAGEPMSSIGRRFDRESSSVFSVISPTGGIRPPAGVALLRQGGVFLDLNPGIGRFVRAIFDRRLKPVIGSPRAEILEKLADAASGASTGS